MKVLRRIRQVLRLPARQVFVVPVLPEPEPLTVDQWLAVQDAETATYPVYRHTQLAELAQLEETRA
uniref:hypothetical protein n=1 Tax=Micromonospora sp. NBC_00855 TaxID=2975978 RepID=UPI00225430B2|nr:hypothetical protein OHB51_35405 [Micromonospora sp. NBC_00855]